jgi:hypothetical protein
MCSTLTFLKEKGKGNQCLGVYMGHPVPGGNKYRDLALQVGGVSRIGTIKYGLESRGTVLTRTSISLERKRTTAFSEICTIFSVTDAKL